MENFSPRLGVGSLWLFGTKGVCSWKRYIGRNKVTEHEIYPISIRN